MTNKKYRSYYKQIAQIMASHVDQQIQQLDTSQPVPISKENVLRIEKISKKANSPFRYVHRISKAAAIVIICATITLSVTMGVEAIRTPIVNFFTELFGQIFHVSTEDMDLLDKYRKVIEEPCSPTYLPEGFVQTEKSESETEIVLTYQNDANQTIMFRQSIVQSVTYEIPNGAEMLDDEFMINGFEGRLYRYNNKLYTIWQANKYFFEIQLDSNIDINECLKIAESVYGRTDVNEYDKIQEKEEVPQNTIDPSVNSDILQSLPEGYELISANEGKIFSNYSLKNKNDKRVFFEIFINNDLSSLLSTSEKQETIILSEENIGYILEEEYDLILLWQDGDNVKRLKADIDFPQDELIDLAKSLLPA